MGLASNFGRGKNGTEQKKTERGGGGEEKETLADKPLDFENLRSPANGARDWLDLTCVDRSCETSESQNQTWRKKGKTRSKLV